MMQFSEIFYQTWLLQITQHCHPSDRGPLSRHKHSPIGLASTRPFKRFGEILMDPRDLEIQSVAAVQRLE